MALLIQTPTYNSSGSFHYYLIITVVNISTLYISGYGSDGYSNVSLSYVCIWIAATFIFVRSN